MSARRQHRTDPPGHESDRLDEWVQVSAVVDVDGNKVITLYDDQGRPQTRLQAELILEAFIGPRPPGHVVRFKDGNRLNCKLTNLEWVAAPARRDEAARAIATRERAEASLRSLTGRPQSDSALLVAEDRHR
jgi:HNH endonuclease